MINDINKLLFLDIETVGIEEDLDSLHIEFPHLSKMWKETGYDYCKRRYPNEDLYSNEMFIKKAALLVPPPRPEKVGIFLLITISNFSF